MGRRKVYATPAALRRAVEKYFKNISRRVKLTEMVDSGERTNKGKPIMRERDVLDANGRVIWHTVYWRAPTVAGLCDALGISRVTWEHYARMDGYCEEVDWAKQKIEAWLEQELVSRDRGVDGIKFNLQNNFGWRERSDVQINGSIEEYLAKLDATGEDQRI